jgi:hypothetical protein
MKTESGVQNGAKTVARSQSPRQTGIASVRWLVGQLRSASDAEPPRTLVDSTMQRLESMETAGQRLEERW